MSLARKMVKLDMGQVRFHRILMFDRNLHHALQDIDGLQDQKVQIDRAKYL